MTRSSRPGTLAATLRAAAGRFSAGQSWLGGLAAILFLGAIDYVTGSELSFSIFYLAPIATVTWARGRRRGFALAVVAASVWGVVDVAAGARYSSGLIPVWNSLVRLGFFAITVWLIGEVRRAHLTEQALARQDPLTGVANGRAFRELLDRELARLRRTGAPLTLAYVDLDRFKAVNDTLGHGAGDDLLRAIGGQLAASVRAIDAVARLGGDEFALLLPDTDMPAASAVLERCRSALQGSLDALEEAPDGLGVTIGAVVLSRAPGSVDEALRLADTRMYEGKRAGRGHLRVGRWPTA